MNAATKKPVQKIPLGLPHRRRYMLYAISAGLWLSGVLWLLFRNFMQQQGDFGPTPHPLEAWWRILHGTFSFASIWVFGELWGVHITRGWSARWRRRSGGTLVAAIIILVLTGLGLYYVQNQSLLSSLGVLHWVLGLAALIAFGIHWFSKSSPR